MSLAWRWVLLLCLGSMGVAAGPVTLQAQLQALSAQHGFVIEGLDKVGDDPARHAEGAPMEKVRELLQDYNHAMTLARPGVIGKLRIISRKDQSPVRGSSDSAYIQTTRMGSHHQVDAALTGPNGVVKTLSLLVDTGATTIVLPASLMPDLGFRPSDLQDGVSQTASGTVPIKIGVLQAVRIGTVSAPRVQVSFIADDKLKGSMLLGMSFLQRYRMTIDDAKNELILLTK